MKRLLNALTAALAIGAAAAGQAHAADLDGTLKKISDTGVITIGHRETSIPFSYYDANQKPVGYSIDICTRIVDAVKTRIKRDDIQVKYLPVTSATRIPLMGNGTIDLECASTSNTLDRQKQVAFSVTTFVTGNRFISLKSANLKTIDDLKGKTVLLFFGYASCPDVCPTTMAQLTAVLQQLGEQARDVRILFVSVDPHRDTPDILQAYVNAFNNNAIGVTGNEKQIADLARRYRVAYQIEKPKPGDDADIYDVTHSRGVYIFDNQGKARLLASDTDTIDTMVKDLRQLIAQTQ